jgi:rhodanese-related sulfurtransferase
MSGAYTADEAASQRDAIFLDVRERYEWDAGHVDGAIHIPIGEIQRRFDELDAARRIVVVCQVGQRSALVADFLSGQGYDAHNLEGGLQAWSAAGLPLVATDGGGDVVDGWARDLDGRRLDGTTDDS